MEIRQPDLDALLVAENIASQLERRIAFRRAMKQSVGRTMRLGAKGIKIACSGRLGGASITVSRKPTRLTDESASRFGFSKAKFSPTKRTKLRSLKGVTHNVNSEENKIPQTISRSHER